MRRLTLVTSARFADFTDVPLGAGEVEVAAGATATATVTAGPFLRATDGDHVALGRGAYTIGAVRVELDGAARPVDQAFEGGAFAIAASDAVFDLVLYDQAHFDRIRVSERGTSPRPAAAPGGSGCGGVG